MDLPRVKTGVEGYDQMLNGGYLPNSVNLISGCSGTGKTLFSISFVYEGAKNCKEKCLYLTLEEGMDQIISNCKSVGIDLEGIDKDLLMILDIAAVRKLYTSREEMGRSDSPVDIQTLINLLKMNNFGIKRIVVDSLMPLSLRYAEMSEFRAELFRLRMALKEMQATSVLTTEIPLSSNDVSRFGIEDFLADSVTVLKTVEEKGNMLRIHKQRGSDHIREPIRYEITGKGLKVAYDEFRSPI
jgi:circadian clock protein KaiC